MRTEQEMFSLILEVAKKDERIRGVGLTGSRTNLNAAKDPFQDFDIVYVVTEMQSFIEDKHWIDVFGERMIMQTPENMELFPPTLNGNFSYLMLFTDGNRIDLTLCPLEKKDNWNSGDTLAVVLLDKDNILPSLLPANDKEYWVQKPSAAAFSDCCNEFWWVSTYVAKGLWRQEILYAYDHLHIVRKQFLTMLEWKIGFETNFSLSIGKNLKLLEHYLDEETWGILINTYPLCTYNQIWDALFKLMNEFEKVAVEVAKIIDVPYSIEESKKIKRYCRHVQTLPKDGKEIY